MLMSVERLALQLGEMLVQKLGLGLGDMTGVRLVLVLAPQLDQWDDL